MPKGLAPIDAISLRRLMPMHMLLGPGGEVIGHGPTLSRLWPGERLDGKLFHELFEVRAPGSAHTINDLLARSAHRFRLMPRHGPRIGLRGVAAPLPQGALVNLSFGIDIVAAVREFGLTDGDFAVTDLAMELLYLAEANASVTRELRGLTLRLEGARLAAEEEAMTDRLTGLRNRRAADQFLARVCEAGLAFSVMQIDLDFFKQVNDSLGHAAGDHALVHAADVLRNQIRDSDCAARIGGDEFLVILVGSGRAENLLAMADRIVALISQPLFFEGQPCQVSASIGIVRSDDYAAPDPDMMLADADAALYEAKRAGRGRATLTAPEPRRVAPEPPPPLAQRTG